MQLLAQPKQPMLLAPVAGGSPQLDTIHHCDALTLLRALPDASVSLIATDPPYSGVKDEAWDNQWESDVDYLAWIGSLCVQWKRILKANGSLYVFASPRLAARVEITIAEYFNVLTRITWKKPPYSTKAEMFDKPSMRSYFPASETIIFAEQGGSDAIADEIAGFSDAETKLKARIFGSYLDSEFVRANVSRREIAMLFPSITGGLTGCVSNWVLGLNVPTPEQYQAIRSRLGDGHLTRDYEMLRVQYEAERKQYQIQKAQYEALRRPFNIEGRQYTDVWEYRTVNAYSGKHPAEKPLQMMKDIIQTSSRPGDVVLDCFSGSGTTADAARRLDRRYIACDFDVHWVNYARRRIVQPYQLDLFAQAGVA